MRLPHERPVVFGIAAQPAHFSAKVLDNALPLAGALAEHLLEPARVAVGSGVFVAGNTVNHGRDERVQRRNFVLPVCHLFTPTIVAWDQMLNA